MTDNGPCYEPLLPAKHANASASSKSAPSSIFFGRNASGAQGLFRDRDLVLRWLGNTIFVTPQYCVTSADLKEFYTVHRR
ncbi:hypothetical protein, partial [Bradyrhizobium yuanmingense]|uniref:hypothetical protein n=1 Tax=Bradyrhizobium yuanmingense TaxID=108015 RepID=UPI001AEBF453